MLNLLFILNKKVNQYVIKKGRNCPSLSIKQNWPSVVLLINYTENKPVRPYSFEVWLD